MSIGPQSIHDIVGMNGGNSDGTVAIPESELDLESKNIFIGGIGIGINRPTIFVLESELESIPMELESELIDPN